MTTVSAPVARVTGVNRTLHQGDRGSDVLALQRRLNALHYDVAAVNGSFGYDTLHAVIAFQKLQRMNRDGVVGPAVWSRLTSPRVGVIRPPTKSCHPGEGRDPLPSRSIGWGSGSRPSPG